jgi:hypothetical protein
MYEPMECGGCGAKMPPNATICPHCGWDLSAVLSVPPPPTVMQRLRDGGWRYIVYPLIVAVPIVGFMRLRATGTGPDVATTLRWMAFGDGGRAAELETIHRMHEIGAATSRYMVRENEIPPFDGDWAAILAPSSTARVRGWIPLIEFSADTGMAPASVREMYEVRAYDGWGNPYRVTATPLPRDLDPTTLPRVADDLAKGLHATFFSLDRPNFGEGRWMRLELRSAGRDGDFDTSDDLSMVSYIQVGHVFRLLYNPEEVQQQVERAYTIGRQYFRIDGSRYDLIDARMLAEFRLTSLH